MSSKTKSVTESKVTSEYSIVFRMLRKNKLAMLGAVIFTGLIFVAILAPILAPHDPVAQDLNNRLQLPSLEYPLGTDEFGRCILSRIIYGSRISLMVGITVVSIAATMGILLGIVAGYYGGVVDEVISRFIDIMLAFPELVLAIGIMAVTGANIIALMIALSFSLWTRWARVTRSQAISLREMEYVEAAKAAGASDARIIFSHILPNAVAPILVISTLGMGSAILWEASLSFLGLGVPPPAPSWGSMLSTGRFYLMFAPHIAAFPGLAITLATLAFYMLGDGLRDAFDPRMRVE